MNNLPTGVYTSLATSGILEQKFKTFLEKPKSELLSYRPNSYLTKSLTTYTTPTNITPLSNQEITTVYYQALRVGDITDDYILRIRLPALNTGRYVRFATLKLIDLLEFEIGGTTILKYCGNYLIHDYLINRDEDKYDVFDLSEEERTIESQNEIEVNFSLKIKSFIDSLPIIGLALHMIKFKLDLRNLSKIIENTDTIIVNPTQALEFSITEKVQLIEGLERQRISSSEHNLLISQLQTVTTENITNGLNHNINYYVNGMVSSIVISFLDENNNPIDKSIVESIEILLNNNRFVKYNSSLLNRKIYKETIGNENQNKNLFVIPLYSENEKNLIKEIYGHTKSIPFGINTSQIDTFRINYRLKTEISCKIVAFFKASNILRISNGMSGTIFEGFISFENNLTQNNFIPVVSPQTTNFTIGNLPDLPVDEEIVEKDIPEESNCMISYKQIEQGNKIETCLRCHSIFLSDIYGQWLKHQHKCPYCVKDVSKRTIFIANLVSSP